MAITSATIGRIRDQIVVVVDGVTAIRAVYPYEPVALDDLPAATVELDRFETQAPALDGELAFLQLGSVDLFTVWTLRIYVDGQYPGAGPDDEASQVTGATIAAFQVALGETLAGTVGVQSAAFVSAERKRVVKPAENGRELVLVEGEVHVFSQH